MTTFAAVTFTKMLVAMKILITIFLLAASVPTFAQDTDYRPFIEEGKVWTVEHLHPETGLKLDTREFFFGQDTVIWGKPCVNLFCRTVMEGHGEEVRYVAPLFEKDRVVYFFRYDEFQGEFLKDPVVLYDFSVNVGSKVKLGLPDQDYALGFNTSGKVSPLTEECSFRAVIPLDVHGQRVQCYCYWDRWTGESDRYNFYMEGIGTELAPIFNVLTCCPTQEFKLLECRLGDKILYTADDTPRSTIDEYAMKQEKHEGYEYIPFIEAGKQWVSTMSLPRFGADPVYRWTYYFNGDTIVNNVSCLKFMCYKEDFYNQTDTTVYLFSAYEDNHHVYYFLNGESESRLWYDFGTPRGTVIQQGRIADIWIPKSLEGTEKLLIWADSYVMQDGYKFKMRNGTYWEEWQKGAAYRVHGPNIKWVEGIGSFVSPVEFDIEDVYEVQPVLQECRVGNRLLYRRGDFQPAGIHYSTPSLSNKSEDSKSVNSKWYTLSGRRLPSLPTRKGIYIKDGRKVLIK